MTLHLAIVGAGPTGLDAALAAAARGYSFTLYEAGATVGDHVRQWGHVRLFSPWSLNVSPRARLHLEEIGQPAPIGEDCPTGNELLARVLRPLAASPKIGARLRLDTRVVAIGRAGLLKHEAIGEPRRGERPFRILLRARNGQEWTEPADVVIDCSGTYGNPNPVGDGGIPAPGEIALGERILRKIPDLSTGTARWAGQTVLVVGAGHSAQTAVTDLAALADLHENTRILWALRRSQPSWSIAPDDPLPARAALVQRAQELGRGGSPHVRCIPGVVVEALEPRDGRIAVTLRRHNGERGEEVVDHFAESLINPEPNFFLLGSKSYGRNSTFLMRVGWQQTDEVFSLLP